MKTNYLTFYDFIKKVDSDYEPPPDNLTIWKRIPNVDGKKCVYMVSNYGAFGTIPLSGDYQHIRIWVYKVLIALRAGEHRNTTAIRYPSFFLSGKNFSVHRLVVTAFCDEPLLPTLEVDHLDFCRTNNRADNLEIVTKKENNYRSNHRTPLTPLQKARWYHGKEDYERILPHFLAIKQENSARRRGRIPRYKPLMA